MRAVEFFDEQEMRRIPPAPLGLLNAIFAAAPGHSAEGLRLLDGRYALFEVSEVFPGVPRRFPAISATKSRPIWKTARG